MSARQYAMDLFRVRDLVAFTVLIENGGGVAYTSRSRGQACSEHRCRSMCP